MDGACAYRNQKVCIFADGIVCCHSKMVVRMDCIPLQPCHFISFKILRHIRGCCGLCILVAENCRALESGRHTAQFPNGARCYDNLVYGYSMFLPAGTLP
jgi:hypothetical protein